MLNYTLKVLEDSLAVSQLDNSKKIKSKFVGGTVCKYWLENRCKKGENCEYLHELVKDKLPECPHGVLCVRQNIDCPFKHTPRQIRECVFYTNGYCRDGKNCKNAHIRKDLCLNYLIGFCPQGPQCKFFHLKSLISPIEDKLEYLTKK